MLISLGCHRFHSLVFVKWGDGPSLLCLITGCGFKAASRAIIVFSSMQYLRYWVTLLFLKSVCPGFFPRVPCQRCTTPRFLFVQRFSLEKLTGLWVSAWNNKCKSFHKLASAKHFENWRIPQTVIKSSNTNYSVLKTSVNHGFVVFH